MTTTQQILTIGIMASAVIATRYIPFILFSRRKHTPRFVQFLGKYLASAVFGMLVIYCFKDIQTTETGSLIPKLLGAATCVILHLWRRNILLTIAGGTIFYMLLIQHLHTY